MHRHGTHARWKADFEVRFACPMMTPAPPRCFWESHVKEWIREWTKQGLLRVEGLGPRQRVPKCGEHQLLVWRSAA